MGGADGAQGWRRPRLPWAPGGAASPGGRAPGPAAQGSVGVGWLRAAGTSWKGQSVGSPKHPTRLRGASPLSTPSRPPHLIRGEPDTPRAPPEHTAHGVSLGVSFVTAREAAISQTSELKTGEIWV